MDERGASTAGCSHGETFERLLKFLNRLDERHVHYRLGHTRPESVMIEVPLPDQRWEIEFMHDGSIEVERFTSVAGVEDNPALLDDLLAEIDGS
jgi:hypothetical protein